MSLRLRLRGLWNKGFTGLSVLAVVLLGAALLIVLAPMLYRGFQAVVFVETVEFRKMAFWELGRGDEQTLQAEIAAVQAAREPVYALLDRFSRGIDVERQIGQARELYRRYGEKLRAEQTPREEYTDKRARAKELRDALTDAYEAQDAVTAKEHLQAVLSRADEPWVRDTMLREYVEMARDYGEVIATIDLGRRQEYAQALDEVKAALRKLLGPRPREEVPALAEDRYGATRWDLAQRDLKRLLYDEQWLQEQPGQPLVRKWVPRTAPSQFGGTALEPLFGVVETHLEEMLRPRWRFYWQYFIDGSTPGHFFGGVGPEVLGTLLLTLCAMLFAVPLGIVSAGYLVECGGDHRMVRIIRTCINTLAGVPSIVFGLFGLAFFVLIVGRPCVLAASLTLGLLVLPVIIRASEEAIRAVPETYKEASLALGAGRFRTFVRVILPAALPGILTGIILSVSRAAGETAPILFTGAVFYGDVPRSLFGQTPALSYGSYGIATGDRIGMEMPHQQYGMVMTLILLVLLLNLAAIAIRHRVQKRLRG
ncbi:MAG TPA: phosphate ABC transporter permease PstA [Phycisphaerales bacterium]|nr:phosphate ABC transporter permease PstA [Phycisphaerales bacterium]